MIKLICNASQLKADDYLLEGANFSEKVCSKCDNFAIEDAKHIILQCDSTQVIRTRLFERVIKMPDDIGRLILERSDDILATMMGRFCPGIETPDMFNFWKLSCEYISKMYWHIVGDKKGVG